MFSKEWNVIMECFLKKICLDLDYSKRPIPG